MPPTLLADLAVMMSSSPENVATRALELILRSPAARAATTRLLDTWRGRPGQSITRWASQFEGEDEARTDLQGFDEREGTVAIFENKFWAGLTDNQPSTYLERLHSADGILAFVVPARRVALIAHELGIRIGSKGGTNVTFGREGEAEIAHLSTGCTIAVASWSVLLSAIGAALEAAEEYDKRADLHQLEGLVAKMETEGYRPFTSTDLTGDTPHLVLQLCELVDGAVEQLLTRPFADKKNLKATAGQGWYGHYVRIHGYGCQLVMSSSRWSAHGVSPVWLRVSSRDWKFQEDLRLTLRSAIDDASWLQEEHGYSVGFWIPIRLTEGLDRDAVLRDVLRQLDYVASALEGRPAIPLPNQVEVPPPPASEEVLPPTAG